ncbi:tRNA dihydrouridine(20/20a) synthase DusA [Citreimonas sp.]|uniref:tRNA dihydrouridine(20/20a) synthase DusA n=1 Tax=Citreimonas sp. TaxID=3036715 RepID=UPI0035C81894
MQIDQNARLSVAPMMDWTDRHCRYFHRLISGRALLYTEMVTASALVRGGALHLLDFDAAEHPVALQLGGSDPAELAQAARLGARAGYDEINLNCGCPSDRVQSGTFGAVLMRDPALVARCVAAMRDVTELPVTVKCRIGVDDQDPEEVLPEFLARIVAAGCERVTVHARKAWLQGLSPKENRDVPPLDYDLVLRMKQLFPNLHVSINGGVDSLDAARALLDQGLDGVMVGRAAYHQPWDVLAGADAAIWGDAPRGDAPEDIARAMMPYAQAHVDAGGKLSQVTRHMLGLFAGRPGARAWRRTLSEQAVRPGADATLIETALSRMEEAQAA